MQVKSSKIAEQFRDQFARRHQQVLEDFVTLADGDLSSLVQYGLDIGSNASVVKVKSL